MSQDSDKLTNYNLAVESFEYLEAFSRSLFDTKQVDLTQIIQGLHTCYQKIENIISDEDVNSSYLVELFQIKHHLLEMREVAQNKIINRHVADESASTSKIHSREKVDTEKQQTLVESTIETPRSNGLKDIAGLWDVKKVLKSLIILPRHQPQLFVGRKACNSVLLFGPPGTGKTRLVHALAYEANAVLHSVSTSDMLSPLVGQTEKNIQALFEYIGNGEHFSILFIDEIDGFCRLRNGSEQDHTRRMKTELMCQMSKLEDNKNTFLICATNCPWDLDTAFLRRFQKRIYIPLPNVIERIELFQLFTKNTPLENNADHFEQFIHRTEGFSGSDLSNLISCALNIPLVELEDTKIWKSTPDGLFEPVVTSEDLNREDIVCCELDNLPYNSVRTRAVRMQDLMKSLDSASATVSSAEVSKYEDFARK